MGDHIILGGQLFLGQNIWQTIYSGLGTHYLTTPACCHALYPGWAKHQREFLWYISGVD